MGEIIATELLEIIYPSLLVLCHDRTCKPAESMNFLVIKSQARAVEMNFTSIFANTVINI